MSIEKLEYPSNIFANFEDEFEKFKAKNPQSLIMKYYEGKYTNIKHSRNSKDYETIGPFKGKNVNGPTFVMYGQNNFYFGIVVEGVKQGDGYHLFPNGFLFKGRYSKDMKSEGKVIDTRDGKDIYVGSWGNDNYRGEGWLRNPFNDYLYEGRFIDGLFEGHGKLTFDDQTYYEGNFSRGEKNEGSSKPLIHVRLNWTVQFKLTLNSL